MVGELRWLAEIMTLADRGNIDQARALMKGMGTGELLELSSRLELSRPDASGRPLPGLHEPA